jgi:hypothetical protein
VQLPTSNNSQPSTPLTFLLDRTHQSKITAKLLRDLDMSVEVHKRHYLPAAPDPEWIADATSKGWVIVSGDKGIELDGINRQAVSRSGAKVFLLADTESRGAEWAASLVVARHKMIRVASQNRGPFYCTVGKAADDHVKDLRFLDGGGPYPRSPGISESHAAVPEEMLNEPPTQASVPSQGELTFPAGSDLL